MISICLCSSSNIVSGLSKGVRDSEGVYQDVLFYLTDKRKNLQISLFVLLENMSRFILNFNLHHTYVDYICIYVKYND